MRPKAATPRRTTGDGSCAGQLPRSTLGEAFRRSPGALRTLSRLSLPVPGAVLLRVVHLRSAVCMLGRFPALAGVDLDVEAGEIVLLAGPNGAGKTTLLRLIAGFGPLVSGEATVFDVDLTVDRRAARRQLALVGHETFCYDDLTVRENLRFVARAWGGAAADADPTIERLHPPAGARP